MQRTEDDIITTGHYCEALMRDDHFNSLCDEFNQGTVKQMLSTKPDEHAQREALYAEVKGLQAFLGLLLSYVESRNKLLKPIDADDSVD